MDSNYHPDGQPYHQHHHACPDHDEFTPEWARMLQDYFTSARDEYYARHESSHTPQS